MVNPPLELSYKPLCPLRCAIPMKTTPRTSGYTLAPTKLERVVNDSKEGCHTRSSSPLSKRWKEYHGSKD
uniref:Uncharacterized protein n=1 Tax=Helianthus annuus TaxID=4232 RepID=A0A251S1P1_HELAN